MSTVDLKVRDVCSEVLLKCKIVLESVEKMCTEEELLKAAKNSATSTFKLGNLVKEHLASRNDKLTTKKLRRIFI